MARFIKDIRGNLLNPDAVATVHVLDPASWATDKGKWFARITLIGTGGFFGPEQRRIDKSEYDALAAMDGR
jgi:hypothetical protein